MKKVMSQNKIFLIFTGALFIFTTELMAAPMCGQLFPEAGKEIKRSDRFSKIRPEVQSLEFDMPGMKVGSVTDPTLATGATVFLFDKGATASYDARGGSVASIETNLLDEGSYDNSIDGILFAGGSTMGLEATQGVRRRIFDSRDASAGAFDLIPSIPGAVVYDYGARIEKGQNKLAYPGLIMGAAAYDKAVENKMLVGRVGAGTSATANKVSGEAVWGGQGAAFKKIRLNDGSHMRIFAAVILNAHGNINLPNGVVLDHQTLTDLNKKLTRGHKQNTTLSLIVTDVALDRNQLKRLATMVHTSMASSISPFHSYTDGDILFSVSLNKTNLLNVSPDVAYNREEYMLSAATETMREAILTSVITANSKGTPQSRGHKSDDF